MKCNLKWGGQRWNRVRPKVEGWGWTQRRGERVKGVRSEPGGGGERVGPEAGGGSGVGSDLK